MTDHPPVDPFAGLPGPLNFGGPARPLFLEESLVVPDEEAVPLDPLTGEPLTGVALAAWQIAQQAVREGKALAPTYTITFPKESQ